jgi:hypothetical protein
MSKTKITTVEIESLIAFGEELDRRMKQARIGFAELSRLTGGAISTGYISDIVRAGRGDSQKYFRLGREKVVTLAKAIKWNTNEALDFAGFKSAAPAHAETIEEALEMASYFEHKGLNESDREELRPVLKIADREVERILSRPHHSERQKPSDPKVIQSKPRKRDKIDEAIDAALSYGGKPVSDEDRKRIREILERQLAEKVDKDE